MNKFTITLAAALALGAGAAGAQVAGPFEGGEAATFRAPAAAGTAERADRATVAAEGRAALRGLDSRSGYQSDASRAIAMAPAGGGRSRAEVREEARETLRGGGEVFEGGQAGTGAPKAARPMVTARGEEALH